MVRVHSFEEMREVLLKRNPKMELAGPRNRKEHERKCRICGSVMEHISGTNIYVCHGEVPVVDDDGKEVFIMDAEGKIALDAEGNKVHKMEPCTNFALGKA